MAKQITVEDGKGGDEDELDEMPVFYESSRQWSYRERHAAVLSQKLVSLRIGSVVCIMPNLLLEQ